MSNTLGSDAYDCAILGEGNTSAKISEDAFLVKASGTQLRTIYMQNHGFIAVGATEKDVLNITQMAVKTARPQKSLSFLKKLRLSIFTAAFR